MTAAKSHFFSAPMAKTRDGNYFLDANPLYFQEILDYLRYGEINTEDTTVLKGVKNLANFLGLTELVTDLGFEHDSQWITLDVSRKKAFEISLKSLTRFKNSTFARYFLGDKAAIQSFSQWIKKEKGNRYFIDRPLEIWEILISFMKEEQGCEYKVEDKNAIEVVNLLIKELDRFGLKDYYIPPRIMKAQSAHYSSLSIQWK